MRRKSLNIDTLHETMKEVDHGKVGQNDEDVLKSTIKYIGERLIPAVNSNSITWESFLTFYPPRMLYALRKEKLICFFGAGLSIPSGLPSWTDMLRDYFMLDQSLITDDDLQSDPLTQAELVAHQLGADKVQALLREKLGINRPASTNHLLAASLRLPFYITTNYDVLFEQAWRTVNSNIDLELITNDADLSKFEQNDQLSPSRDRTYLLKIHGSICRPREHLILTRSDYRRHYRINKRFFNAIIDFLSSYHILFLGFGHKDPEVTRLVEEAIWKFEKSEVEAEESNENEHNATKADTNEFIESNSSREKPNFYSLQFNMRSHTPEIFAARGIVALEPPLADPSVSDFRSSSLARGLADLVAAGKTDLAAQVSLDHYLNDYAQAISVSLQSGLNEMKRYIGNARAMIDSTESCIEWMNILREKLGELAGQGLYLLDDEGQIINYSIAPTLTNSDRTKGRLADRPYFRQAMTYRQPFVSDSFESKFNKNSTFTLCLPILNERSGLVGLMFSACQVGAWKIPIDGANKMWNEEQSLSVLLVDANGVVLMPPNHEFLPEESIEVEKGEYPKDNIGYPYSRLLSLSRRDKIVSRMMENIVPLRQDDDVLSFGPDLKQYTVVTELQPARWKIGISRSIFLSSKV